MVLSVLTSGVALRHLRRPSDSAASRGESRAVLMPTSGPYSGVHHCSYT